MTTPESLFTLFGMFYLLFLFILYIFIFIYLFIGFFSHHTEKIAFIIFISLISHSSNNFLSFLIMKKKPMANIQNDIFIENNRKKLNIISIGKSLQEIFKLGCMTIKQSFRINTDKKFFLYRTYLLL